jgi:hypothetical protein
VLYVALAQLTTLIRPLCSAWMWNSAARRSHCCGLSGRKQNRPVEERIELQFPVACLVACPVACVHYISAVCGRRLCQK